MGVVLPKEFANPTIDSSKAVAVHQLGANGYEPVALPAPGTLDPHAKAERLTMLIASGAGGLNAQEASIGIQALDERTQGGPHPLAMTLGQKLQEVGAGSPVPVEGAASSPSPVSSLQKATLREI